MTPLRNAVAKFTSIRKWADQLRKEAKRVFLSDIPIALGVVCLLLGLAAGCRTQTLHEAVLSGNLAGVKRQLDRGADINAKGPDGWTPLMLAADKGKLEVVKILLDRGADVNAKDADGWTPLMLAVEHEPTVR